MSITERGTDVGVMYNDYVKIAKDLGVTAGGNADDFGNQLSKHMSYALNNQNNYNVCTTNRINFQVPVPLFMCEELIYVPNGDKLEICLQLSNRLSQNSNRRK